MTRQISCAIATRSRTVAALLSLILMATHAAAWAQPQRAWPFKISPSIAKDSAVAVALRDLRRRAEALGFILEPAQGGGPSRLVLEVTDSTGARRRLGREGFTLIAAGERLSLQACSPLGLAYGLFYLSQQIAMKQRFPARNLVRIPALPYRVLEVGRLVPATPQGPPTDPRSLQAFRERWKETLATALRFGYNILRVHATEDFVPWRQEPYKRRAAAYRVYLRAAVEDAHRFHLKVLLAGDEFLYLPGLFKKQVDTLSVKDDALWEALAEKYRRLLKAAPYLDGVSTRIGEVIPRFDFRQFDFIHAPADSPDPRVEERYRRFLLTLYRVAVEEFGKLYLHRTWVTNSWEQHSVPEIYRRTFEGLPTKDLLVAIKLTKTDQWYYWVPCNPTFGQTRHTTLAQAELGSFAHGGETLLDFPGFWYEAALRDAVEKGARGVLAGVYPKGPGQQAASFVFARLAWEPMHSARALLMGWLRSYYGRAVARELARVFELSAEAIRDGLYVRPWALQEWNPIPHLRGRTFMFAGRPLFDHGRGHERFLRQLYLQAKPWGDQTLKDLDRGIAVADTMLAIFQRVAPRVENPVRRQEMDWLLRHEVVLLRLNRAYVADILRYFRYRETRSSEDRKALAGSNVALRRELEFYKRYFGTYNVRAIALLLSLSEAAVRDLTAHEDSLRAWPGDERIEDWFQREQKRYKRVLAASSDQHTVYHWKGTVDGSDLLIFEGDSIKIEHFLWAYPQQALFRRLGRWDPTREELVIRVTRGRGTVFLMPNPSRESVAVYVEDPLPGADVVDFDVVAVGKQ